MRIGLLHDPLGDVGRRAVEGRGGATGKARDGEIEASPEKTYRTCLADETGAELAKDPMRLTQSLHEADDPEGIVAALHFIVIEGHGVLDLARHGPDMHLNAEAFQSLHDLGIESRDRHRAK